MKSKVLSLRVHGFTLVELLLGLAITAIIGVSVFSMFFSGVKLDDKLQHLHENYVGLLLADHVMTHDLENAITLDFSSSYPDALVFEGRKNEFSFLIQTSKGIRHIRYFCGIPDDVAIVRRMTGRVVNPLNKVLDHGQAVLSVDFLMRQESSLVDWLNETTQYSSIQVIAASFKKNSFHCQYSSSDKDLSGNSAQILSYSDTWDKKILPSSVSCSFTLYDPKNVQYGLMFKREIFLSPIIGRAHEQ